MPFCMILSLGAAPNFSNSLRGHLTENTVSTLIGSAPTLGAEAVNAGSRKTVLKNPRVIESGFTLTVAEAE
ncbi:MAG: hypothetical protein LBF60_00600 [Treponema sp.]|nr:hypothetical protein [Treponema sp.]